MKIICIGRNYADHARELDNPVPEHPVVFLKPATALLNDGKPFYLPDFSEAIHFELELVVRILKNGRHVQPEFAHTYYRELGLGIDFTARDLQRRCKEKGHPWEIAKAFDHSAPVGGFRAIDELPDPEDIHFQLRKNGQVVQDGHTRDMLFSIDQLIVYVSRFFKLQTGDLLFTGTPAGVGPVAIGDRLEGFLETRSGLEPILQCTIR